jgi:hypothetical protein
MIPGHARDGDLDLSTGYASATLLNTGFTSATLWNNGFTNATLVLQCARTQSRGS